MTTVGGWCAPTEQVYDFANPHRVRTKPLVTFYSTKLHDPENYPEDDERSWQVQAAAGDITCGMDADTLEDALIGARLLAVREEAGWTLEQRPLDPPLHMVLSCWCGMSWDIRGCYADPMIGHVKRAHPEHWTVTG